LKQIKTNVWTTLSFKAFSSLLTFQMKQNNQRHETGIGYQKTTSSSGNESTGQKGATAAAKAMR
jgi:hypothetical protein